jgi:large subunit ribosomal protein L15
MRLKDLKPNIGEKKDRRRVGRGISAGQGKTSGRGTKGQGARTGGSPRLYSQGGNLPLFRRLPFMRGQGFTPLNRVEYEEINLLQLNRFTAGTEITPELLFEAGFIRKGGTPVVILGDGELTVALKVRVHRVSKTAKAKIEAAGGSVETL